MKSLPLALSLLVAAVLSACSSNADEQKLLAQLKTDFQIGVTLAQAESLMQGRAATYSKRTAQECEALVKESRVSTRLQPQGGPCVFGKLPVSRTWYGGRNDVIFQLVFDRENTLKDASFEAIQSM